MLNERNTMRLLTIRKMCSISKAADKLHISRSALVQQVKQIENELGFMIFQRSVNGVRMTPAGDKLLNDMEVMIREYERTIQECRELHAQGTERLIIGALPNFKAYYLQEACIAFSKQYPHIKLEFKDFTIDEYFARFRLGEFDICAEYMLDYYVDDKDMIFQKLGEAQCICGLPRGHKFAGRKNITMKNLRGERLILYRRGISRTQDRVRDYIEQNEPEIELVDISEYNSNLYAKCMIEDAVLLMYSSYEYSFPQMIYLPLDIDERVELGIGYHKECSRTVQQFVELLEKRNRDK